MSTPARQVNDSGKAVAAFSELSHLQCKIAATMARGVNPFTAFSFEFVAKPEEAATAVLALPAAIQSALEDFAGFAGLRALPTSYLDRRLRAQNLPAPQAPSIRFSSIDTSFISSDSMALEEHACVA